MSSGAASGGASAAGAAVAMANAIRACGTIITVEASEFEQILQQTEAPLVVTATQGIFKTSYRYITSYRGLAFYCQNATALILPSRAEIINAKKITVPNI